MLDRLAATATPRSYRRGDLLLRQGESGDFLAVVAHGAVRIVTTIAPGAAAAGAGPADGADDQRFVLDVIGPPGCVGVVAAVDGGPRTASAEAIGPVTVLLVGRDALRAVAGREPALMAGLLHWFVGVVRSSDEQLRDLAFRDVPGRVARLLLSEAGGDPKPGAIVRLDQPARTQRDIAQEVGGTRQTVNQTLRHFTDRGWIDQDTRRIRLLRPDNLRHRAKLTGPE